MDITPNRKLKRPISINRIIFITVFFFALLWVGFIWYARISVWRDAHAMGLNTYTIHGYDDGSKTFRTFVTNKYIKLNGTITFIDEFNITRTIQAPYNISQW